MNRIYTLVVACVVVILVEIHFYSLYEPVTNRATFVTGYGTQLDKISKDSVGGGSPHGKLRQLVSMWSGSSSSTLLDTTSTSISDDNLDSNYVNDNNNNHGMNNVNLAPRVAVFSMFIHEEKEIKRLNSDVLVSINDYIVENHKNYCKLHDYTYILFTENIVDAPWSTYQKPYMFEKILYDQEFLSNKFNIEHTFDYALFLDFDAIFINTSQNILNLFEIIPKKYNAHFGNQSYFLNERDTREKLSIIISGDIGGIVNAGVIAMKKTEFTKNFLSEWKLAPFGLKWEDQGQLAAILSGANSGMKLEYWKSILSTNFYYETMYWSQVFHSYQNRIWDGNKPYVGLIAPIELNIQESYIGNVTYSRTNSSVKDLHYMHDIYCDNGVAVDVEHWNYEYIGKHCHYSHAFILHAYYSDKIVVLAKYLNISNIEDMVDLQNREDIILDTST